MPTKTDGLAIAQALLVQEANRRQIRSLRPLQAQKHQHVRNWTKLLVNPKDFSTLNRQRRADVYERALRRIGQHYSSLGQSILAILWPLYHDELWLERSPLSFRDYCENEIGEFFNDQKPYFMQQVQSVERVISQYAQDEPILNPDTGEVITPEMIIQSPGIVTKMAHYSHHIHTVAPERRSEWLTAMATARRTELEEMYNQDKGRTVDPLKPEVAFDPVTGEVIVTYRMSREQFLAHKKVNQRTAEFPISTAVITA